MTPQNIKEGIQGHPANWYSDVFDLVFPAIDDEQANNIWKDQLAKDDKGAEKADNNDD